MGLASSKGARIYYESFGKGPALLLIAGWGSSGLSWETSLLESLAQNHQVIALDNRGTGRSDKPRDDYSISLLAEDCIAVLNDAQVEHAHILGASMGGLIAQELVLNYQQRVSSMILCCTSCGWRNQIPESQLTFAQTLLGGLGFVNREERLKMRMELLFSKSFVEREWQRLNEHWMRLSKYPTPVYAFRNQWEALRRYDCCNRLSEIRVPTLIMGGDLDRLNPVQRLTELSERINGSQLQIFPSLGHGFIVETREEVQSRILAFLNEAIDVDYDC
jgi:pimeloyl-ACP methyl ester carboxylesterase